MLLPPFLKPLFEKSGHGILLTRIRTLPSPVTAWSSPVPALCLLGSCQSLCSGLLDACSVHTGAGSLEYTVCCLYLEQPFGAPQAGPDSSGACSVPAGAGSELAWFLPQLCSLRCLLGCHWCRLHSRAFLDYPDQISSTPIGSISIDSPEL